MGSWFITGTLAPKQAKNLKKIWVNPKTEETYETICSDKEHIDYLKNNETSSTNNNIIPTEFMTNTKLAIWKVALLPYVRLNGQPKED